MKANEFVKENGLYVFKYALSQLSFKPKMFLVVYQYECEFVHEIKPNHGNCVFGYDDVKRLVESHELIGSDLGYAKKFYADCAFKRDKHLVRYKQAIADVESCL